VPLPFTVDQFFGVFRRYNETIWPAQVGLVLLALLALSFVLMRRSWSGAAVSAILAFLWAWLGLAYHLAFFVRINPAAYAFAAVSLAGALAFVWQGVVRRRLGFGLDDRLRTAVGLALVVFALLIYPLWSTQAGHGYPELPTFGLPCPTTIFTIGVLTMAHGPGVRAVLVVPVLWSLVGSQAAFQLDVIPDLGLLVAAVVGATLLVVAWRPVRGRRVAR
jgi:hypothetical protein